MVKSLPQYKLAPLASTGALQTAGGILMAVEIANVANAVTVVLNDSDDGTGTDILTLTSAATMGGKFFDFTSIGGIIFANGIYATITGASSWIGFWTA